MLTYEQVFEIFKEFLALDRDIEIVQTKRGYLHIVWDWNSPYCEGGRLTKGRGELTAEDVKQASAKCRPYLEKRWEVEKK